MKGIFPNRCSYDGILRFYALVVCPNSKDIRGELVIDRDLFMQTNCCSAFRDLYNEPIFEVEGLDLL